MSQPPVVPPRMKALAPRRSATICALDIGTTKVVCLIGKLVPLQGSDLLPGRSHRCKVLGIGLQRSRGIKGGVIVDMEEAEDVIRHAVDAAERMAKVQVESVIVNITGGRIGSECYHEGIGLSGQPVGDHEIHMAVEYAASAPPVEGRAILHSLPTGFVLDGPARVRDPKGMVGAQLGVDMHRIACDATAVRNLMLAVERCHLDVEAVVASPYVAGLSVLVDDEMDLGTTVVDCGGGTTSVACFVSGRIVYADSIAVGGNHVTMDIARGLTLRVSDAERLKTHFGACHVTPADEREMLSVVQVGEDAGAPTQLPKHHLVRIIKPRIEEILELVRERLSAAGAPSQSRQRIVLAGGASQLPGLADVARRIFSSQIRIGRPLGVQGLPESAKSPAFAASVGLLVYPQLAGIEHFAPQRLRTALATGTDGYIGRVGRWLRDSF